MWFCPTKEPQISLLGNVSPFCSANISPGRKEPSVSPCPMPGWVLWSVLALKHPEKLWDWGCRGCRAQLTPAMEIPAAAPPRQALRLCQAPFHSSTSFQALPVLHRQEYLWAFLRKLLESPRASLAAKENNTRGRTRPLSPADASSWCWFSLFQTRGGCPKSLWHSLGHPAHLHPQQPVGSGAADAAKALKEKQCRMELEAGPGRDHCPSDRCWDGLQGKHPIQKRPFSGCLCLTLPSGLSGPFCPSH